MTRWIVFSLLGLLITVSVLAEPKPGPEPKPEAREAEAVEEAKPEVSAAARKALLYLREEEKLARDVYVKLAAKHDIQAFRNISGAEQRHMDAVLGLLKRFEIPDVVGSNAPGVFTNPTLRKIYAALVARGLKSPEDALAVGAAIEEMDIADLRRDLKIVKDAHARRVLENLHRGSRNHLRAFTSLLRAKDLVYVPVHLTQKEFDAILAADHEPGHGGARRRGGGGGGRGHGRGQGGRNRSRSGGGRGPDRGE